MSSQEAIDQMNQNWTSVAPMAFSFDKDYYSNTSKAWAAAKIKEHYLGEKLVGNDTLLNLANAYTDSTFMYTSKRTALSHGKHAPVYLAMLAFKGIWSQSFGFGFSELISKN